MSGLFGVIETGKNSLFVQQAALQIINHNIANAATEGYSRQRVLIGARTVLGNMGWPSGDGVQVLGVQRVTDMFMVSRLGRAEAEHAEKNALVNGYDILELIFEEPVDDVLNEKSLGNAISDFLDSWQDALNPENGDGSGDIRSQILESARLLALRFNDLSNELSDHALLLESEIESELARVNTLLEEIAHYNSQIVGSPLSESARGNIQDARQAELLELASLTGAEWTEQENGSVSVRLGSRILLQGNSFTSLELSIDRSDSIARATIVCAGETTGVGVSSGSLCGRQEMLNDRLPELQEELDVMARNIIEKANAIHQEASGSQGGGVDIFTGTDAASMVLNSVLDANPELLSTSGMLADGRSIADAIFGLHYESMGSAGDDTLEDYYASMIGELGGRSSSAQQLQESSARFKEGIRERLESVTGVSLDEELANMMMVQAAFQASSRVITVADTLLEAILDTI